MNIAEILKYCPKGTKLYSTVVGEVTLDKIDKDEKYSIIVHTCDYTKTSFTEEGRYVEYPTSECVIFPSKDQRDWKKFRLPVKRGDIMMSSTTKRAFIASGGTINGHPEYICGINAFDAFQIVGDHGDSTIWTSDFCIPASEEAKEELFDEMTEAGYKWNADTLELEKIEPMFKEGDIVIDRNGDIILVSKAKGSKIISNAVLYTDGSFTIYDDAITYFNSDIRLASITERNKFYSSLVRKGYKYDKEQHLLIKQEFKPFDKVLIRDKDTEPWKADIYLGYDEEDKCYRYKCTRMNYRFCIPYEGNEYLLGTTDSPI